MADGDDLPDTEYRSIYGAAAELARFARRVQRLEETFVAKADALPAVRPLPPLPPPPTPEEQAAAQAKHEAFLARVKTLPSWGGMAHDIQLLLQGMAHLKARVEALEHECEALRQEALTQFWDRETKERDL